MEWKFKLDMDWLKERQKYLTASEINQLIPFTETGRRRTVSRNTYLNIYSTKIDTIKQEDCWAFGPAARGHILEPYAIQSFNAIENLPTLNHWDNIVIPRELDQGLAYSPDALDITPEQKLPPTILGEVKCYEATKHMQKAQTIKSQLKERWQIATAMAVSPTIETGYLILFNPDIKIDSAQLFVLSYDQDELQDEIDIINQIEDTWLEFCESNPSNTKNVIAQAKAVMTTDEILKDVTDKNKPSQFNP